MKLGFVHRLRKLILAHWDVPLHKNTYLLSANLLVTFVSGILFWIIATRLFSPAQIGTVNAFLAPIGFLSIVLLLGSNYGLLRFVKEIESDPRLMYSIIWSTIFISFLGSILGFLIVFYLGINKLVLGNTFVSLIFYIVIIVGNTLWTICEAVFVCLRVPIKLLIRNIVFGILRLLFLLLIPYIHQGEVGLLIAYGGGIGLAAILSLDLIRRNLQSPVDEFFTFLHPFMKEIISFSLPNHFANVIASIPGMVLPLIVFNILGAETNGYFSLAWIVIMIPRTVLTASSATFLSESSRDNNLLKEKLSRSIGYLLGFIGMTILPLIFFPKVIMSILGPSYAEANKIALPVLAVSVLPLVFYKIFNTMERIKMRIRSIFFFSCISCLLGVVFPWIGATFFGYIGFVIAYLVSQLLLGLMVLPRIFSN